MIRILLIFLFLVFSCEKNLISDTPVWGCMDSDACNYNSQANRDDDSCIFQEDNYDCDSNCIAETSDGCDCGVSDGGMWSDVFVTSPGYVEESNVSTNA